MIFNSIIHKDYTGVHIQLKIYNDRLVQWNDRALPDGYTMVTLLGDHASRPRNKNIAAVFYRAGFIESWGAASGMIEAWGRGFDKIKAGCEEYGGELPDYDLSENVVMVLCKACPEYVKLLEADAKAADGS